MHALDVAVVTNLLLTANSTADAREGHDVEAINRAAASKSVDRYSRIINPNSKFLSSNG